MRERRVDWKSSVWVMSGFFQGLVIDRASYCRYWYVHKIHYDKYWQTNYRMVGSVYVYIQRCPPGDGAVRQGGQAGGCMGGTRQKAVAILPDIVIERGGTLTLNAQLFKIMRELILSGRLRAGERLPPTRVLARDVGVSRNTVTNAFQQLLAEGYVQGAPGAGTYVAAELPNRRDRVAKTSGAASATRSLSARGAALMRFALPDIVPPKASAGSYQHTAVSSAPLSLVPGIPDIRAFPWRLWSRLMARSWRGHMRELMMSRDPAGFMPLRAAVAGYLRQARGVRAEPEQVMIVAGAQQAVSLIAHILLESGDTALVEDPGYNGVHGALLGAGVRVCALATDADGLRIADAHSHTGGGARLICIAPSNQYPMGVTMPLARRLAVLEWAQRHDGWVIEDDYDSEYRYTGRPLSALQGLDRMGRVLYLGSFSKVLFPSLRLGYVVVPQHLVDIFCAARSALDAHSSTLAQPALAQFIDEGHLAAHLRRTRKLYAERMAVMLMELRAHFGARFQIPDVHAGMHITLVRRGEGCVGGDGVMWDVGAVSRARRRGFGISALSPLYHRELPRDGIILGFAATPSDDIRRDVGRLAAVI